MEIDIHEEIIRDGIVFYSVLYSSVSVLFAMAVLSKFLTNQFRFGFRAFLSLVTLFIGEPLCQFLVRGPSGLMLFSCGCLVVYYILPANHLPAENKAVLITGCDSGIGNAVALKLDQLGLRVFAGCLDTSCAGAVELKRKSSNRLHVIHLDVTEGKSITAASEYINNEVGEAGLWGLVNNAGVYYFAEIEMTSEAVWKKVMDVNLFGAIRVTKTFLNLVKKAQGRILNVASPMGHISLEGNGAYSVSKHGLVAYSNTLRLEMRKWGVDVTLIEPTLFSTPNNQPSKLLQVKEEVWSSLDVDTQEVYGKEYLDSQYSYMCTNFKKAPADLTPVVNSMCAGLLSRKPRARYGCGVGADTIIYLYSWLPMWGADILSGTLSITPRHLRPQAFCSRV